ncbi:UDPGT domain-containing protein [Cinnamomum micranthum f. kanehirae]|uniref:UDPGT domain-containing protein n=1 Tax=Cinnamomum micranthum f. kanehirae TaxID=337451 RepID=A0A3S3ML17_9MAGN|nr:UDPGT domain-containing protein [Cinnamomum micranthum f. kanehirae]
MAKEPHVLMFPWLAFGHMLPFLELSKSLAKMGLTITFISTPRNIQRLPPIPPNLTSHLHLLQIPLPAINSLPENSEATIDVPEQMAHVFSAATLAFVGSPAELRHARKRTKPEDFMVAPDWIPFPSTLAHRHDQAVRIFHNLNVPDESKLSSGQRLATTIEGCDFVLVRSCREFEGKYLDLIKELYQKPVLPVGLLPPALAEQATGRSLGANMWSSTFQWLDTRPQKSVVFVGFGSEFKITKEQVHELGFGLDLSGLPFVWVLGKPAGSIDDSDLLPPGFETHIADRGIVSVGWVPQLEILGHPAIGGFLFHFWVGIHHRGPPIRASADRHANDR